MSVGGWMLKEFVAVFSVLLLVLWAGQALADGGSITGAKIVDSSGDTLNLSYGDGADSYLDNADPNPDAYIRVTASLSSDLSGKYVCAAYKAGDSFKLITPDFSGDCLSIGTINGAGPFWADTNVEFSSSSAYYPGIVYAVVSDDSSISSDDTFVRIEPEDGWLVGNDGSKEDDADPVCDSYDLTTSVVSGNVTVTVTDAYADDGALITQDFDYIVVGLLNSTGGVLDSAITSLNDAVVLDAGEVSVVHVYVNGIKEAELVVDGSAPAWSLNKTSPASPVVYFPGREYEFNVTWNDNIVVSHTVLEFGGVNYSMGNVSNEYFYSLYDLGAGDYSWRVYANDTSGNWNVTDLWSYSVTQADSDAGLLLNGTDGNFSVGMGDVVNMTASSFCPGVLRLYFDGVLADAGVSPLVNMSLFADAGLYNITGAYAGDVNCSSSSETHFLEVEDIVAPLWSGYSVSPGSPAGYLAGQEYMFNVTWVDNAGVSHAVLEFDGVNYSMSNVSSEYFYSVFDLAAGSYLWRVYANDSSGNLNVTDLWSYVVSPLDPGLGLLINGTDGNFSSGMGDVVNVTASSVCGGALGLYFDGELAGSGVSPLLNLSSFADAGEYNITVVYGGHQNCSPGYVTHFLTVVDDVLPVWSLNKTNPVSPANYSLGHEYVFNVTWSDNAGVSHAVLEFGGVNYSMDNVSSEYFYSVADLGVGNYSWRVYANDTSGNRGVTDAWSYSVVQSDPGVLLLINGVDGNSSVYIHDAVNVTASSVCSGILDLYFDGVAVDSGVSPLVNMSSFGNVGVYNITAVYEGDVNCSFGSVTYFLDVRDNEAPSWSLNKTSLLSPASYYPGQEYEFNVTWSDNVGVSHAVLEFGGVNYSMSNVSSEYFCSMFDIGVGSYLWRVYANDTSGNMNVTDTWVYTVDVADKIALYLDGVRGAGNYVQGDVVNLTAVYGVANKTVEIWANFTGAGLLYVASGASGVTLFHDTGLYGAGVYNVTALYAGDANHTTSETWLMHVSEIAPQVRGFGLNGTRVFRGGSLLAYAEWSELINYSVVEYGLTESLANVSVLPDSVWTNYTFDTDAGWGLGNYSVRFYVNDSAGLWNRTDVRYFEVRDWASLGNASLSPAVVGQGQATDVGCRVVDVNASEGIEGYSVYFYNSTDYLGSSDTGSDGWAYFSYVGSEIGYEQIICNTTDQFFYNASVASRVQDLYVGVLNSSPLYYDAGQSDDVVERGGPVSLYAYWTDVAELSEAWIATNESGAMQNKTSYGSPLALFGTDDVSAFVWSNSSVVSGSVVGWRIYANDINGMLNVTPVMSFVAGDDVTAPIGSGITTVPYSPAYYLPGRTYVFGVRWTDAVGVDTVLFESNFTGDFRNYTVSGPGPVYYYDYADLLKGSYVWRVYANDTSGNMGVSALRVYVVNAARPLISLLFNGTNGARAYNQSAGDVANISALLDAPGSLVINMTYPDGSVVNLASGMSPLSYMLDTVDYDAGDYYVSAYFLGDENYSSADVTHLLMIVNYSDENQSFNDLTAPVFSNNMTSPLSPAVYAPGNAYVFNITCTDELGIANITFFFGGVEYDDVVQTGQWNDSYNYSYTFYDLAAGDYSYWWYAADTYNNSGTTDVLNYAVQKAPSEAVLYLDRARGNVTQVQYSGKRVDAEPELLGAPGTVLELWANFSGSFELLATGGSLLVPIYTITYEPGVYGVRALYPGSSNYESDSEMWYVTIVNASRLYGSLEMPGGGGTNTTVYFYSSGGLAGMINGSNYTLDLPVGVYNVSVDAFGGGFVVNMTDASVTVPSVSDPILVDSVPDADFGGLNLPPGREYLEVYVISTEFSYSGVTLAMAYLNDKGLDEGNLLVFKCSSDNYNFSSRECSEWQALDDFSVDAGNDVITLSLDSLSAFAIGGVKPVVTGGGDSGGSGGGGGGAAVLSVADDDCVEEWVCGNWSECSADGVRVRVCVDANGCGTADDKPDESGSCVYGAPRNESAGEEERYALFDIYVELAEDVIDSGGELLAKIGLINFGDEGLISVNLSYVIEDAWGNVVYEEDEVVDVETQREFLKGFDVSGFASGEYTLFIDLKYEGQNEPAQAQKVFFIGRGADSPYEVPVKGVAAALVVLLIAGVYVFRRVIWHGARLVWCRYRGIECANPAAGRMGAVL